MSVIISTHSDTPKDEISPTYILLLRAVTWTNIHGGVLPTFAVHIHRNISHIYE